MEVYKWSGADEQDLEVIAHHELPQATAHFSQWYSDQLRDIQQKVRTKELFCSKSPVSSHFLWNFLSCSDPGCTEHCCNLSNQKLYCLRLALSSERTPESFIAPVGADQIPEYLWFKKKKNMEAAHKYICTPE